jgi:hypothetical protein
LEEGKMPQLKTVFIKRSPLDRRSPVDRRILDIEPGYPTVQKRKIFTDRRRGWEDRFGWERISRWSSSPIYTVFYCL